MINDARQTQHYLERKQERGKILGIKMNPAAYAGYELAEVTPKIIEAIQERLFRLLRAFEGKAGEFDGMVNRGFIVLYPKIVNEGKKYSVTMHVKYTKVNPTTKKTYLADNYGEFFELIVRNNALITLLLLDEKDIDEVDLIKRSREHLRREEDKYADNPIKIVKTTNYEYEINLKTLMQGEEVGLSAADVSKDSLPYRVKSEYRKGKPFEHDEYGNGVIVNTSAGTSGIPGPTGVLDWVDVDFGKPYVKSGQFTSVRRIPKVYVSAYWLGKA